MRARTSILAAWVVLLTTAASLPVAAGAQTGRPLPLVQFGATLADAARKAPGRVGIDIMDLTSGYASGVNSNVVMPAASTIKIPIMVEVFRQLQLANFDLNARVELLASDKDYGSGTLCDAPVGTTYPVSQLLQMMIDISDNTAANMLIRLVGRQHINQTMYDVGAPHTRLYASIHTAGWSIRDALRTSAGDMVSLLTGMAKSDLVDEWSSKQMIAILEEDQINSLLPEPLPQIPIAHKTGSLGDTLNDVGIVYEPGSPYVIAVMTTNLPTLSSGRRFIRHVSKLAYSSLERLARWRDAGGDDSTTPPSSDVPVWRASPTPEPTARS